MADLVEIIMMMLKKNGATHQPNTIYGIAS